MKNIIYLFTVSCALFFMSSCAPTSSIQSNKLTTYTGFTRINPHQKIMLVMYGKAGREKFYNKVAAEFTDLIEKEHEINVVYKIWTPLSFDTQADIEQAIKKEKADFVIEIQQGQTNKTAVAVPTTEDVATTSYVEKIDFLLSLKSTEVNQVFWKATTSLNKSAVGYVLSNRLFAQLKKDRIIDANGQLGLK